MSYFMRIRPVGADLFNADGHDDAYCNSTGASKICAFCPHCIYVFCDYVCFRTHSYFFYITLTNWFHKRDEMCLLPVRTGSLNKQFTLCV